MTSLYSLSVCLACCWLGIVASGDLRIVKEWREVLFAFPSKAAEEKAIEKGYYVPRASVPIDLDIDYTNGSQYPRIFVTVPRFSEGSPVTLGTLDKQGRLAGYPDYSWHDNQGKNCNGMTSVFRTTIDQCDRLWVIDTGKIDDTLYCTPQLLAFDLWTDKLIYRHQLTKAALAPNFLLITSAVDIRGNDRYACDNTFVYLADVSGFAITVVDVARRRDWHVTHRFFYPYPSAGNFTINGVKFDIMDGILGMALSPYVRGDQDRNLYFHALSSVTENVVKTSLLRNESFIKNSEADPDSITVFPKKRPNQSAAEAMDRDGILYFGLMEPPSIWCWNSETEFSQRNFHPVAINRETLQFASGVKIITNPFGEQELWVLTSSFQKLMTGTLSPNETNFRIQTEKVPKLMKDSPCKCRKRWG